MRELKRLAAGASKELRQYPNRAGEKTRALANYLNALISGAFNGKRKFDADWWAKIAGAMHEDPRELNHELIFWAAGIGGQISLLCAPNQHVMPEKHLLVMALNFCDAVDLVG